MWPDLVRPVGGQCGCLGGFAAGFIGIPASLVVYYKDSAQVPQAATTVFSQATASPAALPVIPVETEVEHERRT